MADTQQGLQKREEDLEGTRVALSVYEVSGRFHCKIDNIDPGTIIGRGHGATVDEAIDAARRAARVSLQLARAEQRAGRVRSPHQENRGRQMTSAATMTTFAAERWERRVESYDGFLVGVTTYRLGDVFVCRVDNIDPGANVSRARAASLEEARSTALETALRRLGRTRRLPLS